MKGKGARLLRKEGRVVGKGGKRGMAAVVFMQGEGRVISLKTLTHPFCFVYSFIYLFI